MTTPNTATFLERLLTFFRTAASITYDNTESGLAATDVQAAIDEIAGGGGGGGTLASVLAAGNTTGGENIVVSNGDSITGQSYLTLRAPVGGGIELLGDLATGADGVNISLTAGSTDGASQAGSIFITSGTAETGPGGGLAFSAGPSATTGGDVSIFGGTSPLGVSGGVVISSGAGDVATGTVTIKSSNSGAGGGTDAVTGNVLVASGDVAGAATGTTASGTVTIKSGDNPTGNTGNVVIDSGTASGTKGTVRIGLYTLPATDGTSGQVLSTDGAGNLSWITP